MRNRPWTGVVAAIVLALFSLLSNVQSQDALEAQGTDPLLVGQIVVSLLTNGALWAILLILSGWSWGRTWWAATLWAVVCGELALGLHYGLGWAVGFFDWEGVLDNLYWFVATAIAGVPLGALGSMARRHDGWGLATVLVIPVGLIAEPFWSSRFTPSPRERPATALASQIAGSLELVVGVVLLVMAVVRFIRSRPGATR